MRTKLVTALAISAALLGGSMTIVAAHAEQAISVNCEAAAPNQSGFGSTAMSFRMCRNTGAHGNYVAPTGAYHYTAGNRNADQNAADTGVNQTAGNANAASGNL